jgi:hypothetical protein
MDKQGQKSLKETKEARIGKASSSKTTQKYPTVFDQWQASEQSKSCIKVLASPSKTKKDNVGSRMPNMLLASPQT